MSRSTLAYPASRPAPNTAAPASGVRLRSGYSRARATIERRIARTRTAPARAFEVPGGVPRDPRWVDVFAQAPEEVPARTRVVRSCARCAGALASTSCPACGGAGCIASWIEIVVERVQRVRVSGDGPARARHLALFDPLDFERPHDWPNLLLHQAWFREMPPHLSAELRLELAANERIVWFVVQTFVG